MARTTRKKAAAAGRSGTGRRKVSRRAKKKPAVAGRGAVRRKKVAGSPSRTGAAAPGKTQRKKKTALSRAASRGGTRRKRAVSRGGKPPRRRALGKELRHFRNLLLKKRRELIQSYTTTKGDTQAPVSDGTEDYIDYAVSSYAREFLLSLTELDRQQLGMVEEALQRIERRDYGRCLQCGTEIPKTRLEAVPWVRFCIRCQELSEQGLLPQLPSFPESSVQLEPEVMDDDELEEGESPGEEQEDEEEPGGEAAAEFEEEG